MQTVSANGNGSYTVTITSLTNDTTYRFRVRTRASSGHTASAWTSFVTATPTAQTSSTPIWSATLTVKEVAGNLGCLNALSNVKCSSTSVLTDDDFTLSGTDWAITGITSNSTELSVQFSRNVQTALDSYSFCVGTTALAFSSASHTSNDSATWSTTVASGWSADDTVSLSIGTSCPQVTRSTNANLSGLTAGSSTSSTGTFTDFSIGTFGATTTTYTASVANDQTHVKLTPTVADTGKATVGVRKGTAGSFTTVTSGSASGAIELDVGANTLVVRVTAEDTTTTKDYTVTVTRQAQVSSAVPTNVCVKTGLYPATGAVVAARGTPFISYNASNPDENTYSFWEAEVKAAADNWPARTNMGALPAGSVVDQDPNFAEPCAGGVLVAGLTPGASYDVRFYLIDLLQDPLPDSTTPVRVTMPQVTRSTPKATTAVSGTMTVGVERSWKGFQAAGSVGALSDTNFTSAGVDYKILGLRLTNSGYLDLHMNKVPPRESGLVLNVGDSQFKLSEAALFTGPGYEGVIASWGYANLPGNPTPPTWTDGQRVPVSLGTLTSSTVKLSVRPNPVSEGASASVEACLSAVPQGTARIPVVLSHGDSANRSEDGDWGVSLTGDTDGRLPVHTAYSIAISGWLQRGCGVVQIPTHPDSDDDDETFTVALDTDNLPPGVQAGIPASVVVTIQEPRNWPKVTLRAVRETVAEGSPVELQVTLEKPPATDVKIPLRVRWASSESGDHGFLNSITIAAGATSGSGTIRTYPDDDTDDEYFTVAVIQPDLPEGVAAGRPSTVGIVIVDAANARLRALGLSGN